MTMNFMFVSYQTVLTKLRENMTKRSALNIYSLVI